MPRITKNKVSDLSKNYRKFLEEVKEKAGMAIEEYEKSIEQARIEATPEDTGDLLGSYKVTQNVAKLKENVVEYTLSYGPVRGDNGENYAAEVHEWPLNKNWTKPGSGSKFLERPVYSTARNILVFLQTNFNKIVRL